MTKAENQKGLATWKFTTLETVDNDPALTPACLSPMLAALSFKNTWDATPFLPTMVLMARTGISSTATIVDARARLIAEGYWNPVGKNERGLDTYAISNPKRNGIIALMEERAASLKEADNRRKLRQRESRGGRKKGDKSDAQGSSVNSESEITRPSEAGGANAWVISKTECPVTSVSESVVTSVSENKYVDRNAVDRNTVEGGGASAPTAHSSEHSLNDIENDESAPSSAPEGADGASSWSPHNEPGRWVPDYLYGSDMPPADVPDQTDASDERNFVVIREGDDVAKVISQSSDGCVILPFDADGAYVVEVFIDENLEGDIVDWLTEMFRDGRLTAGLLRGALEHAAREKEEYLDAQ